MCRVGDIVDIKANGAVQKGLVDPTSAQICDTIAGKMAQGFGKGNG